VTIEYKQAYNDTLNAGSNTLYTAPAGTLAQIRAATAHNPTVLPIVLVVSVGGNQFVKKTLAADATQILSELLNHQVNAAQTVTATGEDLNIILSVAEVV